MEYKGQCRLGKLKSKDRNEDDDFALEMVDQWREAEWTAEMQFQSLLSIGRKQQKNHWENLCVGREKIHSWWVEEVTEAIKRRKQACGEHRNAGICMNAFQTW